MNLDIAFGNIHGEIADRLGKAAITPLGDDVVKATEEHLAGTAEPWISHLVHTFILATGAKTVLETGSFLGGTSIWIVDALRTLGSGTFHFCEIDEGRFTKTALRLADAQDGIHIEPHLGDVLDYLTKTTDTFDLAWVDDCHEKPHVRKELELLYPKMNPGGVILGHDVHGTCDLQEVFRQFGGLSIDLPRLGAAGGMGIIQIPRQDQGYFYRGTGSEAMLKQFIGLGAIPMES